MSRILIKIVIMFTIIFIAVFYYFPLSQGQIPESPFEKLKITANKIWLNIKKTDISMPKLPELPKSTQPSKDPVTVYRWQDASGQWHFSNSPPASPEKAVNYSSLVVNPDSNVIQSVEPSKVKMDLKKNNSSDEPVQSDNMNPYSKEAIAKLFEQTETIRNNMQQRNQALQDLNQTSH